MNDIVKYAASKKPNEWQKIRNRQEDFNSWCFYNALKKVSEAIQKNDINEIAIWEHIAKGLSKNNKVLLK